MCYLEEVFFTVLDGGRYQILTVDPATSDG